MAQSIQMADKQLKVQVLFILRYFFCSYYAFFMMIDLRLFCFCFRPFVWLFHFPDFLCAPLACTYTYVYIIFT